ncbi:MAG: hypothetical protein PHG08_01155 [Bacilli bacterium]|nr:hypothetical protein [Bacilli bacterium]
MKLSDIDLPSKFYIGFNYKIMDKETNYSVEITSYTEEGIFITIGRDTFNKVDFLEEFAKQEGIPLTVYTESTQPIEDLDYE